MKISAQNITEGTELISSDGRNGAVAESDAEFIHTGDTSAEYVEIWLAGAPRRFKATAMLEVGE